MTFDDIIKDIQKLAGLKLDSIKPGAEIVITEVDLKDGRIWINTNTGCHKSRPLSEIRLLWEHLCKVPAIHVDEVLSGSGSSRNQPETILANLPYIEWFRYDHKKHIALVGTPTHAYGTLKLMDEPNAEELRDKIRNGNADKQIAYIVVVSSNVVEASQSIENVVGLPVKSIEPGIYIAENKTTKIIFLTTNSILQHITSGTYLLIEGSNIPINSTPIKILGKTVYAICSGGLQIMVVTPENDLSAMI